MSAAPGRIVYFCLPHRAQSGGAKMIFRSVEGVRALGHEAVVWVRDRECLPTWFRHEAPVEVGTPLRPRDIWVVPEDGPTLLTRLAALPNRKIVYCQNPFYAATGLGRLPAEVAAPYREFLAAGELVGRHLRSRYPGATVGVVPSFVDASRFAPAPVKEPVVAFFPRKRPVEALYIEQGLRQLHPRHAALRWVGIEDRSEEEVARVLAGAELFLSLSRLEGLPLSTLEAMASGCLCAGFTGINGREYATADNGLWVAEDDCDAAVEALATLADLVAEGGPRASAMRAAAQGKAARYDWPAFLGRLGAFWSEALARGGPL